MNPEILGAIQAEGLRRCSLPSYKQPGATERVDWDQNTKDYRTRFSTEFEYAFDNKDASTLKLTQTPESIGTSVYTAAVAAAKYLEHTFSPHQHNDFTVDSITGLKLVELGSGTGLVGLVAAHLGAQVILSDLEGPVLDNLTKNVASMDIVQTDDSACNGSRRAQSCAFDWSFPPPPCMRAGVHGLIAIEVVYTHALVPLLLRALIDLTCVDPGLSTHDVCSSYDDSNNDFLPTCMDGTCIPRDADKLQAMCDSADIMPYNIHDAAEVDIPNWIEASKGKAIPDILFGCDKRGRTGLNLFFRAASNWFKISKVARQSLHPAYVSDSVELLILSRCRSPQLEFTKTKCRC